MAAAQRARDGHGRSANAVRAHAPPTSTAAITRSSEAQLLSLQRTAGNRAAGLVASQLKVQRDIFSALRGLFSKGGTKGKGATAKGGTKGADKVAEPPKELEATDVVLSMDPAYVGAGYIAWFKTEVGKALTAYGFAPGDAKVEVKQATFLGLVPYEVMALAWNPKWGAKPKTEVIPFNLRPIRARLAVAAAHALPGWADLPGPDQTLLDNKLGGEANDLSAATRTQFEAVLSDLKGKAKEDQVKGLKALFSTSPGVVAEEVATKAVGYKVGEPTVEKDYAFKGAKADAEVRVITYDDGVSLKLVAPKAPTPGYHNHSVAQTAEASSYLSKSARSAINTVMLNPNTNPADAHWAVEYKTPDFHSYMTAGAAGVVTIYPDKDTKPLPSENYMRGTMVHETGHTWSYKTWGQDTKKGKWLDWKKAMDDDRVHVSDYAKNSISEDVAETIQVYGTTAGSTRFDEYKSMVPNRFKILEAEYK